MEAAKEVDPTGAGDQAQLDGDTPVTISEGAVFRFTTTDQKAVDVIAIKLSPDQDELIENLEQISFTVTTQTNSDAPKQNYPDPEKEPEVRIE